MSWNAPQNWSEVVASVERGFSFHSMRLRVTGDSAVTVCGHYSTRARLDGHVDDFARRIIASHEALAGRYLKVGRWAAERPGDVAYFVCRDGMALAYLTRAGELAMNPAVDRESKRYHIALLYLLPALDQLARKAKRPDSRRPGFFYEDRDECDECGSQNAPGLPVTHAPGCSLNPANIIEIGENQ